MTEFVIEAHRRKIPIDHPNESITLDKINFKPMIKIADYTTTSNITSIVFEGLDINTYGVYQLIVSLKNPTTYNSRYFILIEGETSYTNCYLQYLQVSGTSITANRANDSSICYSTGGQRTFAFVTIVKDPDGYVRYTVHESRYTGAGVIIVLQAGCKTNTVTNVTRIEIKSEIANAIGAGSRFILLTPQR